MCEFIRAAVAAHKFPGHENVAKIDPKFVSMIKCVGADAQTQICAANERSFFDTKAWYFLFDGEGISFDNNPNYKRGNKANDEKKEDDKDEEDEEESDEEKAKRFEAAN